MLKVLLTKGLPASGKSTWAKSIIDARFNSYKIVCKDDLRDMLDNGKWSKDAEKFVIKVRDSIILDCLGAGKSVIVADTNLAPSHETHIRELVKNWIKTNSGKAEVEIVDFTHLDVQTCIERDLKRPNSVGSKVIWQMYNQYLAPKIEKPIYLDGKPGCIICDLDGTLSLLNGRDPYDASTCDNDELNRPVWAQLQLAHERELKIILLSGREDKYKEPTERFLATNQVPYSTLLMRRSGDFRKDSIIKTELYETYIKPHFNVKAVYDDRLQVCRMWHQLGLPLFRVGDPDADF